MKIGLTGSIACGKSTVSGYLRALGYAVVDADEISRSLTAPGGAALPALRARFGEAIFCGDNLDRKALGSLVFSSKEALSALNAILHPMIISQIACELDALDAPGNLVFGDVPLLYECHMEHLFDRVFVVRCERETQIARLLDRDGLSREDAVRRIDAQMPLEEKCARADAVICSEGSIEHTRAQVRELISSLISP